MQSRIIRFLPFLVGLVVAGCGAPASETSTSTSAGDGKAAVKSDLSGSISIDGSSTVGPISEAVAEEFGKANPGVKPTVAMSGTGGGFKKFAAGEIDIAGASRPIEEGELANLTKANITFIEIPIAFDGLSVVVNPQNDWATDLSVEELRKIWEPGSKINNWSQVRAGFPNVPLKLYGAGTDSGTFDYFTKVIVGKEKSSRTDYQASEDDNTLVQGVAGDKGALGYFGFAYAQQNADKVRLVKVNGVAPSPETIESATYTPLSRPLFWYINTKSLERPEVRAIVDFMLTDGRALISEVGYVALPDEAYETNKKIVAEKRLGTRFHGAQAGLKVQDILNAESK